MGSYRYRAYSTDGRLVAGTLDSPSREAAYEALRRQGAYPVDLDEVAAESGSSAAVGSPPVDIGSAEPRARGRALTAADLALLTRELATLVKAQLPLDEALRLVALQPLMSMAARRVVTDVLDRVVAGASLSEALAADPADIPELHWRLVAAAERSGTLGPSLVALADHLDRVEARRRRVRAALLYPVILLVAAAVAMAVVIGVLVPAIAPLFEDAGAPLPPVLAVLRGVQTMVAEGWLLGPVALAIAGIVWVRTRHRQAMEAAWHRGLLRLPVIGPLVARAETGRFSGTLATLLGSGVPLLDALPVVGATQTDGPYRAAVAQVAADVARGQPLSEALRDTGCFPELTLRLVAIGERTGDLPGMLIRLAEIEATAQAHETDRLLAVLAPALTVTIGLAVGGIILSVMGAITGLNDLALR